jgi:hypothetical protein
MSQFECPSDWNNIITLKREEEKMTLFIVCYEVGAVGSDPIFILFQTFQVDIHIKTLLKHTFWMIQIL